MIKTEWFTGGFLRDNGQYIELELFGGKNHTVRILIEVECGCTLFCLQTNKLGGSFVNMRHVKSFQ
jgi:hypothetical protein